jgi:transposase
MLGAGCESSPTGCSWPTRMPEKYLRRFAALPRGRNCALQLRWPELELLKSIDGVGDAVAHAWLAEIGPAPHGCFGSHEKLASWVTLCPGNHMSAAKRSHGHTGKAGAYIKPMLAAACRSIVSLASA